MFSNACLVYNKPSINNVLNGYKRKKKIRPVYSILFLSTKWWKKLPIAIVSTSISMIWISTVVSTHISTTWISTVISTRISTKYTYTLIYNNAFMESISTVSLRRCLYYHTYTSKTWNTFLPVQSSLQRYLYCHTYTHETWNIQIVGIITFVSATVYEILPQTYYILCH